MGTKRTIKKKKEVAKIVKKSIQEIEESRTGGQIALTGFSYQFLYSCYIVLSDVDEKTTFRLEGIEDVDHYKCEIQGDSSAHIQLKYSTQKQDASFLKDVLKNFIEVYLFAKNHHFKLVYDFEVVQGNLSKMLNGKLDEKSIKYWKGIIQHIREENVHWKWEGFCFEEFIDKLSFEKQEKNVLAKEIEKLLIEKYDILTDNINLFANSIKICCLEKMERRESIDQDELNVLIQNVKDDIAKGTQNPAHGWIKKLDFDILHTGSDLSYFEGKKATPKDIAMQLPIRRIELENEIQKSIQGNRVTVIKASSGQGKTTMALQVAFNLRCEYTLYQLRWCNDPKELYNIVQYFKTRVQLGEKPIIIIDNLDVQVSEWNRLAQLLQEEVSYHYKILLTTREDDWYNYSGNVGNVKSLHIIKIELSEYEAKDIFDRLQKEDKLHSTVTDWRSSWAKVADKKLLIEFVYLLTHGEMISERVDSQISQMSNTTTGKIKCEILRKVCFADIYGTKIAVKNLVQSLVETTNSDYSEILKSIENEFLIRANTAEKYVEGLHPVRSQHIVDRLHEFIDIDDTALQVVKITNDTYLPKICSKLPQFIINKKVFYSKMVDNLWRIDNISIYLEILRGVFSGSILQYYYQNRGVFDDANNHGGLVLMSTELNPFIRFEEFKHSLQILDEMKGITPQNANIQYLCNLRDTTPKFELEHTDIYYLAEALFVKFKNANELGMTSEESYASIAYWLLNINSKFNISKNILLEEIWIDRDQYSVEAMANILYTSFCGNREEYDCFVEKNLLDILIYLKRETQSLKLFLSDDKRQIHVEYILLLSNIQRGNEESVSRLKTICKALPIFEVYCADAIMPVIDSLSAYNISNDAHKTIPIKNIVIMFHQEFTSLWDKTIMSNYECDSVFEWLNYWFNIRTNIAVLLEKCVASICKLLQNKKLGTIADEIDNLRIEIDKNLVRENRYPNEDRPFEEKSILPQGFIKIKTKYFGSIQNFNNQLVGFLRRDMEKSRLALINLTTAYASLNEMQNYFGNIVNKQEELLQDHEELCVKENQILHDLLISCKYFKEHLPTNHFNKYEIKHWHEKYYSQLMLDSKRALNNLAEHFEVTYPTKYYTEGILKFYPVIIDNLDMTDSAVLISMIYLCTPIIEFEYDYLVVASKNLENQIVTTGLRIPVRFLSDFKIAIETENEDLMQKLSPPFPEEVKQEFLQCFEQQYDLFSPNQSAYGEVGEILELLWAFSIYQNELIEEYDAEYLKSKKESLQEEVNQKLKKVKDSIAYQSFCEIVQLCDETFKGSFFDEDMLNIFYTKLLSE